MKKSVAKMLGVFLLITALLGASVAVADTQKSVDSSVSVTEYALPPGVQAPFGISAGPGSSVWFGAGDYVGRVTDRGRVTTYQVPTANARWVG